jgi:hypothetical protein
MGDRVTWRDVAERVGVSVLAAALCVMFLPAVAVMWVMLEASGSEE